MNWLDRFAISPCCNPKLSLDEVFSLYSAMGFEKFEGFTSWAQSALDIEKSPEFYLDAAQKYGLRYLSFHLPPVVDDEGASLDKAVQAAEFAEKLGAEIVLFKADSRDRFVAAAKPFLDRIAGLNITPVLQNHFGTPISSLEDFAEVLERIGDERMKTLLEVGHFHSAGVSWSEGYSLLGDSIALVHIKDQKGRESVPYGTGEIDLPALWTHLDAKNYQGDYVVEMEVSDHENTAQYLRDALQYIASHNPEGNNGQ